MRTLTTIAILIYLIGGWIQKAVAQDTEIPLPQNKEARRTISQGSTEELKGHYLEIQGSGQHSRVEINGFPIWESPDDGKGFRHTTLVTPYLLPGKNKIQIINTAPKAERTPGQKPTPLPPAILDVKIEERNNQTSVQGKPLFVHSNGSSMPLVIPEEEPGQQVRFLAGRSEPGKIFLTSKKKDQWAFGIQIQTAKEKIQGRPTSFEYSGLSQSLDPAEIHFLDGRTGNKLIYKKLKLPKGDGRIYLPEHTEEPGGGNPAKNTYDSLWVFGISPEGKDFTSFSRIELEKPTTAKNVVEEFETTLPYRWIWQDADDLSNLNKDPRTAGQASIFAKKVHTTMDTLPASAWGAFFQAKARDTAVFTGEPLQEVLKKQENTFQTLARTPGWKLQPLNTSDIQITPVNSQILKVTNSKGNPLIRSSPLGSSTGGSGKIYELDIYICRINGTWTVVR